MSEKSILFLHRHGPKMASYRYRAQIPALQLQRMNGYKVAINEPGAYEILVLSKPSKEDIPAAEFVKREGGKVVVDFGDDHFNDAQGETYRQIGALADGVVTASEVMRNRIHGYIGKDAVVISDPYEQPESEPHADGDDFLWFGHQTNLADITSVTQFLNGRNLRVVTGPRELPNSIMWNPENMVAAFRQSNCVLLPTREGAEFKTANRLINSLRAGCFAVCMDHPAYTEFRDFVWVGVFYTGLQWATAFRKDLNERVKAGQDYIRDRYSPKTIGKQWADYLESV